MNQNKLDRLLSEQLAQEIEFPCEMTDRLAAENVILRRALVQVINSLSFQTATEPEYLTQESLKK